MNEVILVLSTMVATAWLIYYIEKKAEPKTEDPRLSKESWKYLKPNTRDYDEYMVFLEDERTMAIERQSYEYAAHIRDRINELLCKQNK